MEPRSAPEPFRGRDDRPLARLGDDLELDSPPTGQAPPEMLRVARALARRRPAQIERELTRLVQVILDGDAAGTGRPLSPRSSPSSTLAPPRRRPMSRPSGPRLLALLDDWRRLGTKRVRCSASSPSAAPLSARRTRPCAGHGGGPSHPWWDCWSSVEVGRGHPSGETPPRPSTPQA
jgi:hypothetical protein